MRAPAKKPGRKIAPAVAARLNARVTLEAMTDGNVAARFDGYAAGLGKFSAEAMDRARGLRTGLPLASFSRPGKAIDREVDLLVRRLAERGLLEYRVGRTRGSADLVVIEPQMPGYWPQPPKLRDSETIVLSRFAYMRRRGNDMVLESPRAGALFKISDPSVAAAIATLSAPQKIGQMRRHAGFPGLELLGLLLDCKILFKVDAKGGDGRRANEGDENLVLWDFHDLLFHTHSTEGRQANPLGDSTPTPKPSSRHRRYVRPGPARQSICNRFRPRSLQRLRLTQSC